MHDFLNANIPGNYYNYKLSYTSTGILLENAVKLRSGKNNVVLNLTTKEIIQLPVCEDWYVRWHWDDPNMPIPTTQDVALFNIGQFLKDEFPEFTEWVDSFKYSVPINAIPYHGYNRRYTELEIAN